ncbi:MAG: hypothetical protein RSE13_00235 [Planktothrix sp. GU0601_MAG3]|nr:MAG: hypothetical protein RSE13_00235 [Planktothrix sp. GU0601_MAG3]
MNNICRFRSVSLSLVSALSLLAATIPANAVEVLAPGSEVEGKTIAEWTTDWWKWAFNQSMPTDAFTDQKGEDAGINQSGPVFFIAGTAGGNAKRSFTVPGDKYLLLPMLNAENSYLETGLKGKKLQNSIIDLINGVDNLVAKINGETIPNLFAHREQSPLFNFFAAENNPFRVTPGFSGDAYGDGYYLMLAPLGSGKHTLEFGGALPSLDFSVTVKDTVRAVSEPTSNLSSLAFKKDTTTAVPEPTFNLSLLAFGASGAVFALKRKHKQLKSI